MVSKLPERPVASSRQAHTPAQPSPRPRDTRHEDYWRQVPPAVGYPQRLDRVSILGLQRTVGNHMVRRLLAGARQDQLDRQDSRASALPKAPTGAPIVQRKMISYSEFKKMTFQEQKSDDVPKIKASLSLAKEREKAHKANPDHIMEGGIDDAFKFYEKTEKNKTLQNLVKIQDAIMYWKSFNVVALQDVQSLESKLWIPLRHVHHLIEHEVTKRLMNKWNKKDDIAAAKLLGADQVTNASKEEMPDFVQEVGIAPGYYQDHLKGTLALTKLQELYNNLNGGNLKKAELSLDELNTLDLPGFKLIRSLFLSHFSHAAQLGDFVGTQHQTGELTAEEMAALNAYVKNSDAANSALRGVDLKAANFDKASPYKALVSALTKLPPYKGLAFRGQSPFKGMAEVWKPGAVIADLSFISAASSFSGAEFYLNQTSTAGGSKNLYSIIDVKSASNLAGVSAIPLESEVLFRPGTRLRIKAIWQHINGKVPPNAPHAARSILLRVGEVKADRGLDKDNYEAARQKKIIEKGVDWGEFDEQPQVQVKVFEMEEI